MKLASSIEKIIYATHNQMRTNPKSFIPMLDNSIKNFATPSAARLTRFGRPDLITQEGVNAWHEAKQSLRE